ncbi:hypothetical protein [Thauera humireducens]|uniref:hypothetical protein n=1 Tax=Thauera humireducens TaxID=1134435 RepID=UPI00311ED998
MKALFLPAIRLLDRLNYPLKFSLILLVCGLSAAALLAQIFVSLREDMTVAEREIAGLTLFDAGFGVVLLAQQHRGLNAGVLGGSTELIPRREAKAAEIEGAISKLDAAIAAEPMWQPLQPDWLAARGELQRILAGASQMSAPQSFKAHTEAIARLLRWIGDLGGVSGLSQDPDPATSNLIGPLLTSLPELSERLGQLRARGTNIIARREVLRADEHGVVALLAEIARTEATLLESLERAGKANAGMAAALERSRTEIAAAIANVRQAVTRDILEQQFTPLRRPTSISTQAITRRCAISTKCCVLRPGSCCSSGSTCCRIGCSSRSRFRWWRCLSRAISSPRCIWRSCARCASCRPVPSATRRATTARASSFRRATNCRKSQRSST